MSNEEAILVLQNDAYVLYEDDMPYDRQAYYMAIKALEEKRIKTNADRIRSMTDEKLAEWFAGHDAGIVANVLNNDYVEPTKDGWLEWLETGV